ncbi:hybrid sensor histidine kinase/response regulator transcription factor [Lunatimonas salinarum]|uniref:hybrid sensor histidine kinase/response regulator transcription factor n=1 Tax=Lunatimonas salinarum TaxID=1774590 RepID=UPI001ADED247|nr:two-component regulator propeller domain-containing protein [Lunatimonas salinarum]
MRLSIKSLKFTSLIWALLSIAELSFGQVDLSFRQLSVNDGLSQNSAVSITQDREGYFWIATQDGLNKYDGIGFTVFPKKFADVTQESHLQLGKVLADQKGSIWIIPESAVPERLLPGKKEFVAVNDISMASCIHEGDNGEIWIGAFSGQLYRWNEDTESAEIIREFPSRELLDIADYGENSLLITFKDGVLVWDSASDTARELIGSNDRHYYSCAIQDGQGNIWAGTLNAGVQLIENGSNTPKPIHSIFQNLPSGFEREMILDIMVDRRGAIWLATYGQGVIQLHTDALSADNYFFQKQNPRSLHYNDVLCMYEDYTGTLWFGTDGGGLSFYDRFLEKFSFFHNQQVPENIHIDVVRSLYVDENESLWIGTSGKGLTSYHPKNNTWKTRTASDITQNSIASNRVMSLLGDGKGKLWIGYQDEGLSIMDLKTEKFQHYHPNSEIPLPANTVWKIIRDSTGRCWLATRNEGLIQFDPQKGVIQQYVHDAADPFSIPGNNIRTIEEGENGEFWIGTENNGIARFDSKSGRFETWNHGEEDSTSISSNSIKSLYFDGQKLLWIGTNGSGISILNTESGEVIRISSHHGLANDVVYAILPDDNGNLWVSSNKGISKISPSVGKQAYEVRNYTNYDGLATEFNTGAYFRKWDGSLYFGSLEGVYWFNPGNIFLNETPPKTAITGIVAFEQPIDTAEEIALKHFDNTLTISMASLVFSLPNKNEFQYKLEGHDADWVFSGNNHQARYTNLSPGDYTFFAKSSNYDGVWSETPASLNFTILPPWYLTWWAYLGYALLISAGLMWVYTYLKWRWQMNYNLKLKEEEALHLLEIDRFKTMFFTNISHEFRTPLTLISGPVERLISQSDSPVVKSQLNLIKQNSQRLLNLVDQLLEVSKIKSGKQVLSIQKGNLGLLLQSIVSNFFYFSSEKQIRLRESIPLMTEIWFDADKIEKIVGNLLQNAIKYGKPGTTVSLHAEIANKHLVLRIANESQIKYTRDQLSRLFDKFFKPNAKSEGFGIGLPLVKDLVELHNGHIDLEVHESDIFEVTVQIPVDKYAFRPDQVVEEEEFLATTEINRPLPPAEDAPLILVVEDNSQIRDFVRESISPLYRVVEAVNGTEGLYMAFKKIPDLIISDIMMPELDGISLCRQLKKDEKTSHIPIILLTAKIGEESLLSGLEVGADDFIPKPFSTKQLLLRIQKLIELRKNLRIHYGNKSNFSPTEIAVSSTEEKFLERLQKIVDEELMDSTFTVEKFCKNMGMSRMQLHRKLTALTGLSTSAFIRDQRLRLALQRLSKSGETISETAYAVGFSSPSYFIKCFKETYGMTPSEFVAKEK